MGIGTESRPKTPLGFDTMNGRIKKKDPCALLMYKVTIMHNDSQLGYTDFSTRLTSYSGSPDRCFEDHTIRES